MPGPKIEASSKVVWSQSDLYAQFSVRFSLGVYGEIDFLKDTTLKGLCHGSLVYFV